MWKDVYEDFSDLTKSERLALFNAMKEDLFPEEPDKITKVLNTIREARFASGMTCVHCGSMSVKRMVNIVQDNAIYVRIVENHSMIWPIHHFQAHATPKSG